MFFRPVMASFSYYYFIPQYSSNINGGLLIATGLDDDWAFGSGDSNSFNSDISTFNTCNLFSSSNYGLCTGMNLEIRIWSGNGKTFLFANGPQPNLNCIVTLACSSPSSVVVNVKLSTYFYGS